MHINAYLNKNLKNSYIERSYSELHTLINDNNKMVEFTVKFLIMNS